MERGGETVLSGPCTRLSPPSPVKAARTAKPGSIKMKNSVSGFLWKERWSSVRPGGEREGKREMKGFWSLATFWRRRILLALDRERQRQQQMKAARRAGLRGRRGCDRCQSASAACSSAARALLPLAALTATGRGVAGGRESSRDVRARGGRRKEA